MLFAVEGGGFFSSSASGYSKGLTLLLLGGQKKEDKPMKVTPWNQYQLVDQETTNSELQLASDKDQIVRRCASFVCFGRPEGGVDSASSQLKGGPAHNNQEILPESPVFDVSKDVIISAGCDDNEDDNDDDDDKIKVISLKSSLKKVVSCTHGGGGGEGEIGDEHEALCEKNNDVSCQMARGSVQWTDAIGGELFEIREFEMSDYGSDDEFDHRKSKACSCTIM